VTFTSSGLHFSTWRYFDTDFKYVRLLRLTITCLNVAKYCRHFMFSGDLAKLAVTFAGVDRFY